MAQNTILAAGTTSAMSSDTVVAAGSKVLVGLFVASGQFPITAQAIVYIDTPGADTREVDLDSGKKDLVVDGGCTFRVFREQCGTAFGVYTET